MSGVLTRSLIHFNFLFFDKCVTHWRTNGWKDGQIYLLEWIFATKKLANFAIIGRVSALFMFKSFFTFFVLAKFHFDKTIRLAGLVSLLMFGIPHLWKLCDGITFVVLELHFWDLVHCFLISFCFGSEILKNIGPPQPPKKTTKKTWIFSIG